jgi:hypothetical protein
LGRFGRVVGILRPNEWELIDANLAAWKLATLQDEEPEE